MQQPVTESAKNMLLLTSVLSDNTQITLKQTADEFGFHLIIAGKVECQYNTFDHAWEDLGRCVRCATLEEVYSIARG